MWTEELKNVVSRGLWENLFSCGFFNPLIIILEILYNCYSCFKFQFILAKKHVELIPQLSPSIQQTKRLIKISIKTYAGQIKELSNEMFQVSRVSLISEQFFIIQFKTWKSFSSKIALEYSATASHLMPFNYNHSKFRKHKQWSFPSWNYGNSAQFAFNKTNFTPTLGIAACSRQIPPVRVN